MKHADGLYRAWSVIENDEQHYYLIKTPEQAAELAKKLYPKKQFTHASASAAKRAISKGAIKKLDALVMCSAAAEHILKTTKPRKRTVPTENQPGTPLTKKVKTLQPPSPKAQKEQVPVPPKITKEQPSDPPVSLKVPKAPPSSPRVTRSPSVYTITKHTEVSVAVPSLEELKTVREWLSM